MTLRTTHQIDMELGMTQPIKTESGNTLLPSDPPPSHHGGGKSDRVGESHESPGESSAAQRGKRAGDPEGAADDPDVEYLGPVAMVLPPERR